MDRGVTHLEHPKTWGATSAFDPIYTMCGLDSDDHSTVYVYSKDLPIRESTWCETVTCTACILLLLQHKAEAAHG